MQQVLTRHGYTILAASGAAEAVALAKGHHDAIRLLVTDIVMPHLSGPQIYARVATIVPDLAVLYMSGYAGDPVFDRGVSEEGVRFLQKPFTPMALARRVRDVLDEVRRARRAAESAVSSHGRVAHSGLGANRPRSCGGRRRAHRS